MLFFSLLVVLCTVAIPILLADHNIIWCQHHANAEAGLFDQIPCEIRFKYDLQIEHIRDRAITSGIIPDVTATSLLTAALASEHNIDWCQHFANAGACLFDQIPCEIRIKFDQQIQRHCDRAITSGIILDVDATSPNPVDLGTAKDYVIIAKSGISTVPVSAITGDIAVSPIAGDALTGFSLTMHPSNEYSTSAQITGKAYAANYGGSTPSKLTTAVSDMEAAYIDAAGRVLVYDANLNIGAGLISGLTFTPGVYKWGSDINFSSNITIAGSATARFIFQCAGNIIAGSGAKVILKDGALASNIVWQAAGFVVAGTTSHFEGIFLVKTKAVFETGSSLNGRIFAQTATTLDAATITQPPAVVSATRSLHEVY
jgi:hypothetical protein